MKGKVPLNTRISAEVLAEMRGAVYSIPGLKLTDLVEKALISRLGVLRRRYNDGEPFPPREKV